MNLLDAFVRSNTYQPAAAVPGKQYCGRSGFDKFLAELRDDLPAIEFSVEDVSRSFHCMDL